MDVDAIAEAFAGWIADRPRGERVSVEGPGLGRRESWPVSSVAYRLWDHTVALPERAATILGLPPGATYAHAARLLWCLREDRTMGIRSYDEATLVLAALDGPRFSACYHAVDEALATSGAEVPWPDDLAMPVRAA